MAYLLLICQVLLALILLSAATGKLLNSDQFLAALRLSRLPEVLVIPIALIVPILEMCLAIGLPLSTPQFLPTTMIVTVILFGTFTVWMMIVYTRGLRLKCGCFGTASSDIGPRTILRNVILIAVALGGFVLGLHVQSPLPSPTLWMLIAVLSLGMCLMLFQAFQLGRTALVLTSAQLQRFLKGDGSNSVS